MRPASKPGNAAPLALPHTDWLLHRLAISGPADDVARFRRAARGTNTAPWHLDLDAEEERLFAPMATGGADARVLAQELREVVAAGHARTLATWNEPGACPLDLHRLVPIPPAILALGEGDPAALRWLWAHWGTTHPLRDVRDVGGPGDRRLRKTARFELAFWSADWTPWPALRRLRQEYCTLVFDIRPDYGGG